MTKELFEELTEDELLGWWLSHRCDQTGDGDPESFALFIAGFRQMGRERAIKELVTASINSDLGEAVASGREIGRGEDLVTE